VSRRSEAKAETRQTRKSGGSNPRSAPIFRRVHVPEMFRRRFSRTFTGVFITGTFVAAKLFRGGLMSAQISAANKIRGYNFRCRNISGTFAESFGLVFVEGFGYY
jgi:hypothetical protein